MTAGESYSNSTTSLLSGRDAIRRAASEARRFGEEHGFGSDETARLCVVVEELVANLYDHGGLNERDEIELTLASDELAILIVIADRGRPFDPRSAPQSTERPERGGGAGIDIVRAWAQFIDYSATADGNRLELLLPRRR